MDYFHFLCVAGHFLIFWNLCVYAGYYIYDFNFRIIKGYDGLLQWLSRFLPATQETRVRSLCWEDPLEQGTATHSSILAGKIPWTEEPHGLWSMGF